MHIHIKTLKYQNNTHYTLLLYIIQPQCSAYGTKQKVTTWRILSDYTLKQVVCF